MIARATISRCAMPPESAATGSVPAVGEAELLEQRGRPRAFAVRALIPKKRPWK